MAKTCDTPGCPLKSCFSQVRSHVADDVLELLVDMLIEQVTWDVVACPTFNVDKTILSDLMGKIGGTGNGRLKL